MSGEGYFVLKGEFYDAIEMGRKKTEYRDLTPRNLSMSIGIKTVKFQRGYGHPGHPPRQMRFEVSSVRLMDASDRECDPLRHPARLPRHNHRDTSWEEDLITSARGLIKCAMRMSLFLTLYFVKNGNSLTSHFVILRLRRCD